jgi:hypothetical protein
MERIERLARTLVRAASGLMDLPPDTLWCLAVLVAAWWLRDRDLGATFRLAKAGLSAEPLFARLDQIPGLADVAASGMLELGQAPELTRQRIAELSTKGGSSLATLSQWPGWEQAKAIVLDVYPPPEATDELVAALIRRRYSSAEAARILAGKS